MTALFRWIFILVLLLVSASQLQAQEEKEVNVPALKKKFAEADERLNKAWTAVKAGLPAEDFEDLRSDQRSWLGYREYFHGTNPEMEGEYYENATALTESRIIWLQALLKPQDETVTGVWSDAKGGTLQLVEKEGKIYFTCEVVRGPTYHLGSIAGVATWNSPLGWFTDAGRDAGKAEVTNLALVLRGSQLEVIGANTSYYHGARAFFDGKYVKTEKLTELEQAAVVKAGEMGAVEQK